MVLRCIQGLVAEYNLWYCMSAQYLFRDMDDPGGVDRFMDEGDYDKF